MQSSVDVPIDQPPNEAACREAREHRQRHRLGRRAESHTRDEDNGLDALPEHSDKRQDKHKVPAHPATQPSLAATPTDGNIPPPGVPLHPLLGAVSFIDGLAQLDMPLVLHLVYAEQGGACDGDDDAGEQSKGALVVVLCGAPGVCLGEVEDGDDEGRDDEADGGPGKGAEPDLPAHAAGEGRIRGGGEGLLEEGEQDGDDDGGLESFAEDYEEDGNGEEVRHCDMWW